MGIVKELVGELIVILFSVAAIVLLVGVKVQCQNCGSRFYHKKKFCPFCGSKSIDRSPYD